MDKYYIDMSIQKTSDMLLKENIQCESSNSDSDLIEGFSNFGRVNLEKCCPIDYMWSESQKKCVKICDGCSIAAYGNINYEFLHNHGNEFMSFHLCVGDATDEYDYEKLNNRYENTELLDQYDLNYHIDSEPDTDGVQPSEEDPWSPVMGGMYQTSSKQQQMNIREGSITDTQRYGLQDGTVTQEQTEIIAEINSMRQIFCSDPSLEGTDINGQLCPNITKSNNWDLHCKLSKNSPGINTPLCEVINSINNLSINNVCQNINNNICP
jgi:hypothetical protein